VLEIGVLNYLLQTTSYLFFRKAHIDFGLDEGVAIYYIILHTGINTMEMYANNRV